MGFTHFHSRGWDQPKLFGVVEFAPLHLTEFAGPAKEMDEQEQGNADVLAAVIFRNGAEKTGEFLFGRDRGAGCGGDGGEGVREVGGGVPARPARRNSVFEDAAQGGAQPFREMVFLTRFDFS